MHLPLYLPLLLPLHVFLPLALHLHLELALPLPCTYICLFPCLYLCPCPCLYTYPALPTHLQPIPHERVNFHIINPLAELVAPAIQVPRQNSGGTTLAGAAPVTAVN